MNGSDKYDWPMTDVELAQTLGIKSTTVRRHRSRLGKHLSEGEHFLLERHASNGKNKRQWLEKGAVELASRCSRRAAKDFLEEVGVAKRQRSFIESDCLSIVSQALKGFTSYQREYAFGPYKIDLYLPELKIAVECDEEDHGHIPPWKDMTRQKYLEEEIPCRFRRFNPHEPGFNIGTVINEIFSELVDRDKLK